MRNFDVSPLYRSTVGFDRLFDMLDSATRPSWPPYNIEKKGDNAYAISMAVAGFGNDEIELTQHGTVLTVSGRKKAQPAQPEMLHQGLAFRDFTQVFNLAAHVHVETASLQNGLLSIGLVREVPEALKPRRIDIGTAAPTSTLPQHSPEVKQFMEREKVAA